MVEKNLWNSSTKKYGCQKLIYMDKFTDEKATQICCI